MRERDRVLAVRSEHGGCVLNGTVVARAPSVGAAVDHKSSRIKVLESQMVRMVHRPTVPKKE